MIETGFILVGHGSKNSKMLTEFHHTTKGIELMFPKTPIEFSFLEILNPNSDQAIKKILKRNKDLKKIVFIPLLLFSSNHFMIDIPIIIKESQKNFPSIQFFSQKPFMNDPYLSKLLFLRIKRLVSKDIEKKDLNKKKVIILVARGMKDLASKKSFEKITTLTQKAFPFHKTYSSFIGINEPRLEKILRKVAKDDPNEIFIVPYLLFYGYLVEKIKNITQMFSLQKPKIQIKISHHLGPHALLNLSIKEKCIPYLN